MIKILEMNTINVEHPAFRHITFEHGNVDKQLMHRIRLSPDDIATIEIYQQKYKSHTLILCIGNCKYRYITRHLVDHNEFICIEL
jgi:hypothetical protein